MLFQPTHEYMQKKLLNRVNASSPTGATGTALSTDPSVLLVPEQVEITSFPSFGLVLAESAAARERGASESAERNAAKSIAGGASSASAERSASLPAVAVANKRRKRREVFKFETSGRRNYCTC